MIIQCSGDSTKYKVLSVNREKDTGEHAGSPVNLLKQKIPSLGKH